MSDRPLALVTGGCHRLGAAIAAGLAAAGWDLALHGHDRLVPEPKLATAIADAGNRWTVTAADFSDPDAARTLIASVAEEWGRAPRLLVNSAAAFGEDRMETATGADLMTHYAVNCAAPALLIAGFAALPDPDASPGERSVVNILDQRIVQPHGDQFSYTLAKIALGGLTDIAARELAPAIRVNAVAPGLTIPTADYGEAGLAQLTRAMPLGRLPRPTEMAAAVLYLAEARSVTAQTLFVDAGARLKSWGRDFMHVASDAG